LVAGPCEHNMGRDQELIESARCGNYAAVDRILGSAKPRRAGPFASLRRAQGGVGARDPNNGYTALHYAALNGHREVVRLLLSYEASTNRCTQRVLYFYIFKGTIYRNILKEPFLSFLWFSKIVFLRGYYV